jgi:curved DNA-binding protein CbpA
MDARETLGVGPAASDEEIRAAYLRLVKEHPPETSPERFERIRDAYEVLRDPRRRMRDMLFSGERLMPLADALEGAPLRRGFTGPAPWLEVLKPE